MAVHRMNLPNDRNRHTGLAQVLWGNPENIGIERDIPVLFAVLPDEVQKAVRDFLEPVFRILGQRWKTRARVTPAPIRI